ncbi:MAG: XRE family transcriptional regulator [Anaerolineales bacterium]|nr:XRE family transcriptional regulator [Anaerolineales bacterium]
MNNKHVGSRFDDFLREERLLEEVEATAVKRVIAYQIALEMKRHKLTKSAMASRMKTSRAALDRLLDPLNASVSLLTLERAAAALGKKLKVELA